MESESKATDQGNNLEVTKETFAQFDRADFVKWLTNGLQKEGSPYPDSKGHLPFHPFGIWARYAPPISNFLEVIYDEEIPDPRKQMFRKAIGDILDNQVDQRELPYEACEGLIYLISAVKAEEALDPLISFLISEEKLKEENSLFVAMAVLSSFEPSEKVYQAVRRLANFPNVYGGYLFSVIKLLLQNKPLNTKEILEEFEPQVIKLRKLIPKCEEEGKTSKEKEQKALKDAIQRCLEVILNNPDVDSEQYKNTWLTGDY